MAHASLPPLRGTELLHLTRGIPHILTFTSQAG
jgi:hypothetical protein